MTDTTNEAQTEPTRVRIRDDASTAYRGMEATVLQARRRQMGHHVDYRLALGTRDIGWFWDTEVDVLTGQAAS